MTQYYDENKKELFRLQEVAHQLTNKYDFEQLSYRDRNLIYIYFKGAYNNVTLGFDPKSLKPSEEYFCDSCTNEQHNQVEKITKDGNLKTLLMIYLKIKPKAIRVDTAGIFIALGEPIKTSSFSNMEAGIFMPFTNDFNKAMVIEQIDNKAYLYEAAVP